MIARRTATLAVLFAGLVLTVPVGVARADAVREASILQKMIDAAPDGGTVIVPPGTWLGEIEITRPLRLVGQDRPLLLGNTGASVIRIRAANVTVEGFDIDGRGRGDLGRDASGIHTSASRSVVRDCRIDRTLFGVYLQAAHGTIVENCRIRGIREKEAGEKGSGIHVWDTNGFRLTQNHITGVRDGFYIQSSPNGMIDHNFASDLRYGLHYMFSDDNVFEDNTFTNSDAGAALMYSRRITFRRNRFVHNRGYASVGLLFKACDDTIAEDNLIADNARGIFMEGTNRGIFIHNIVAGSDTAIVLYDSCTGVRFEGNSFVGNLTPLTFSGRRTDTVFVKNYWSDNREPDLDGDGFTDLPYSLSNVFDHFRENVTAADLLAQGAGARTLAIAEEAFPVLDPIQVEDRLPLARPPHLPDVPRAVDTQQAVNRRGMAMSIALLAVSVLAVLGGGRLPFGRRSGGRA
ncbi:MAG: nitrous oxide reductase family maturation protein NosD [Thermoanaerobaculia bacterium]